MKKCIYSSEVLSIFELKKCRNEKKRETFDLFMSFIFFYFTMNHMRSNAAIEKVKIKKSLSNFKLCSFLTNISIRFILQFLYDDKRLTKEKAIFLNCFLYFIENLKKFLLFHTLTSLNSVYEFNNYYEYWQ
jgi:hypothetical protein